MTGKDYAWIVTEQALEAHNVPIGILGLKLVNATSEENHIKDSMYVNFPLCSMNVYIFLANFILIILAIYFITLVSL